MGKKKETVSPFTILQLKGLLLLLKYLLGVLKFCASTFVESRGHKSHRKYEGRERDYCGKVPSYGRRLVDKHIDVHAKDTLTSSSEKKKKE